MTAQIVRVGKKEGIRYAKTNNARDNSSPYCFVCPQCGYRWPLQDREILDTMVFPDGISLWEKSKRYWFQQRREDHSRDWSRHFLYTRISLGVQK